MNELLSYRIADVVSVKTVLFALAVLVLLRFVAKLFEKPKEQPLSARMACGACGWKGVSSSHARKCPKCGGTLFPQ